MWFLNAVLWPAVLFICRDNEENKDTQEKHDSKEKSSVSKRAPRFHPYKDKHGGEKKSGHRNRVFISNIPYDMKWQAIKDVMREKGNIVSSWGDHDVFSSVLSFD